MITFKRPEMLENRTIIDADSTRSVQVSYTYLPERIVEKMILEVLESIKESSNEVTIDYSVSVNAGSTYHVNVWFTGRMSGRTANLIYGYINDIELCIFTQLQETRK